MAAYTVERVRLNTDLTRYHVHLLPGVEGTTVPRRATTEWGWQDRFAAVEWDCCGHVMDTLWTGLDDVDAGV
jgi:hypothetical protein